MAYPIRYSSRAYKEYQDILEYIINNFGALKALEIDDYYESVIDMISINPSLFPVSDKHLHLRRCVISSQTTLFYRFMGEVVELISFRDNRLNPEKNDL